MIIFTCTNLFEFIYIFLKCEVEKRHNKSRKNDKIILNS